MKRWAAAGVVVVVAAALAWWLWPRSSATGDVRATSAEPVAAHAAIAAHTASISGSVSDAAEHAIADARVCAVHGEEIPTCVASDARGVFAITGLVAAQYEVRAMAPQLRPGRAIDVVLGVGEHVDVHIVMQAGGVELAGTVSDSGGGPIAGAIVHMEPERGAKTAFVETDKAGHFSLWCAPGNGLIYAAADGYTTGHDYVQAPGSIALELAPESTISGTVIDAATHAPIAGALVQTDLARAVTTDAAGAFRLEKLRAGRYSIVAIAEHRFGISETNAVTVAQHREGVVVEVYPAARLDARFVVTDAKGDKPCARPGLSVVEGAATYLEAIADAAGMHVAAISPGKHAVYPTCAGFASTDPRHSVLEVGTQDIHEVYHFGVGVTLRGIVRDPDGHPARDAVVAIAGEREESVTGGDGAYELRGLAEGTRIISVESKLGAYAGDDSVTLGPPVTTRDIALIATGAIEGVVVDRDGRPIGGARIGCASHDQVFDSLANGAFQCTNVEPGKVEIVIDPHDGQIAHATAEVVAHETSKVRIAIDRGSGSITGRVVDASGAPIRDARLDISNETGSFHRTATAADGSFAFSSLPPGEYSIDAAVEGRPNVTTRDVKHGASVTITLNHGATVEGVVRGPDGPLDDFMVVVRGGNTDRFYRTGGRYRFTGLAAGTTVLTASAGGVEGEITVDAIDGKTTTGDIAIDASVTVVGRVVDLNKASIANAHVEVGKADGRPHRADTGADGRFTITEVSRGPLRCNVGAPGFIFVSWSCAASGAMLDLGDIATAPVRLIGKGAFDTNIEIDEDLRITQAAGSLVVGDVITSVDGITVTGLHADVARGLMIQMAPGSIKVGVARGVVVAIPLVTAD